jgi:RND family efflux transporter MFP subunit
MSRRRGRFAHLVLGLTSFGSLVGALPACSASTAKASTAAPIAVNVARVARKTVTTSVVLDGQIDPYLQASLAPQQSGTLTAVYANEGDHVRKGALLAKIDDTVLRANLQQQQGSVAQAVAKLAQSQIQLPITDVTSRATLDSAMHALEEAKKQQIADAASVANAKLTFEADRVLLGQGYVSATTYAQANATYVAAQQTLASDEDKVAAAQATLRQARQGLANTPLQRQVISENRGAVVQSAGSVAQYEAAVRQTSIMAPFDGVVTSRTLDPGSFASPSQAIFVISQIDPVYVDFNLKDSDLAFVRPGASIWFSTSADPQRRYAGRVASVNAQPTNGTLLYRARVIEPNPDFALRGGLQVDVHIAQSTQREQLTVPRAAVAQNGSTGTIFVIDAPPGGGSVEAQGVARELTVRLGPQTDDDVAISGASVRAGMRVVLGQVDNLHDGAMLVLASPAPVR